MKLVNPYLSTYLRVQNVPDVTNHINRYIITDWEYIKNRQAIVLSQITNGDIVLNPVILFGLTDTEKDIPGFKHPIINFKEKWIAIDARSLVTPDHNTGIASIKNTSEFELLVQRLILNALWVTEKESDLYALKFAHYGFATWVSDNLSKKLHLDISDQIKTKVVSLIYYSHLFRNEFTEEDLSKLVVRLKDEAIPLDLITDIYQRTKGNYDSLDGFCKALFLATNNVKLQSVTPTILVTMIDNNWVSINGKELATLSLEHPPTWISIVYASLKIKSFSRNYIASIVDKINKRGKGDDFMRTYVELTRQYVVK